MAQKSISYPREKWWKPVEVHAKKDKRHEEVAALEEEPANDETMAFLESISSVIVTIYYLIET